MLRSFLIFLSKATWLQKIVTNWKFAWKAASRFVPGITISDAIAAVKDLNQRGMNATLDHLGESTSTSDEAIQATEEILTLLDQIEINQVRANVSVKLTQIGLAIDEKLCQKNIERILDRASKYKNFVRIDMEDSPFTDRTIKVYYQMRSKGFNLLGLVIQSCLYRSKSDVDTLLSSGTRIRLVKGAYLEPPELAYPKKADVDKNYDLLASALIEATRSSGSNPHRIDGRIPPVAALGTHDPKRIDFAMEYASRVGLLKNAMEFQMLYGIRRDLQAKCVQEGYPVRIYVAYGSHWYPYFMRRLAERPANLWFFLANIFR